MKIVFIITRGDALGGASIHVRDVSSSLQKEGHQVLVVLGQEGVVTRELEGRGVPFVIVSRLQREVSVLNDCIAVYKISKILKGFRPDIVSTHTAKAGALGRIAAWVCRIPSIYTPHCWSFGKVSTGGGAFLWIERLVRPFGNRIVCVAEDERQLGINLKVGKENDFITIHNGMPHIPARLHADPSLLAPKLVMVGRFEEQKDQDLLLSALASLKDLHWSLEFVGDGPREAAVRVHCDNLGLSSRVSFLGYRSDVAQILSKAQLFVLISKWEGFPRSIIEAMRAGLPVVASDVGGNRESVLDGKNGYIVNNDDLDGIQSALRRLISSAELRSEFGLSSRKLYESHYSFEVMYEKTKALYANVTSGQDEISPTLQPSTLN